MAGPKNDRVRETGGITRKRMHHNQWTRVIYKEHVSAPGYNMCFERKIQANTLFSVPTNAMLVLTILPKQSLAEKQMSMRMEV